jgi:hypothetical protein
LGIITATSSLIVIMEQLPPFGTAIADVAPKTLAVYASLLLPNEEAIKSTTCKSFSYGPHPRQALDVYYPSVGSHEKSSSAILIFLYGGGLVRGDRTIPNYAHGLAHANVGHFFAANYGYTTVIPDYRLISHGARFPSGGEDVALVVDWISDHLTTDGPEPTELFIMGNSAGGVHASTYLFAPDFAESRAAITGHAAGSLFLKGAVMLSVPFHFREALPAREETLETYYGDKIDERCPLELLLALGEQGQDQDREVLPDVDVLVLNGTLDPEDEILTPKKDFVEAWERVASSHSQKALTTAMMEGQNHISPALSLGTYRKNEETWGHQVGDWMRSITRGPK